MHYSKILCAYDSNKIFVFNTDKEELVVTFFNKLYSSPIFTIQEFEGEESNTEHVYIDVLGENFTILNKHSKFVKKIIDINVGENVWLFSDEDHGKELWVVETNYNDKTLYKDA